MRQVAVGLLVVSGIGGAYALGRVSAKVPTNPLNDTVLARDAAREAAIEPRSASPASDVRQPSVETAEVKSVVRARSRASAPVVASREVATVGRKDNVEVASSVKVEEAPRVERSTSAAPVVEARSSTVTEAKEPEQASEPVFIPVRIMAGTSLPLEVETTASSATSAVGDVLHARLTEDVQISGGTLKAGTELRGRVTAARKAPRRGGDARLAFVFDSVTYEGRRVAIDTAEVDSTARSSRSRDKKIVGGGAAAGLVIGALKNGVKGAVVGAAAGAAAGAGAALIMKGDEVVLPQGANITLRVERTGDVGRRSRT